MESELLKLQNERLVRVLLLAGEGFTSHEIAMRLDLSKDLIDAMLRDAGLAPPRGERVNSSSDD